MGGTGGVGVSVSVELRSRLASRIKALLGSKGLSSEELAESSAISPSRIKRLLDGRSIRITANELTLIAAVLGTPVYSLFIPTASAIDVVSLEIVEES